MKLNFEMEEVSILQSLQSSSIDEDEMAKIESDAITINISCAT